MTSARVQMPQKNKIFLHYAKIISSDADQNVGFTLKSPHAISNHFNQNLLSDDDQRRQRKNVRINVADRISVDVHQESSGNGK
jgi:hypothetical protein